MTTQKMTRRRLGSLALVASLALTSVAMAAEGVSTAPDDWPQFRGPNRDGICTETGLLKEWPEGGPKLLWKFEGLGHGYSTVSIAGGKIFTMGDRTPEGGSAAQFVIALDLASHKELWATPVGLPNDGPSPGSRCTPTVDGERLYVVGTEGEVVCLEVADGRDGLAEEPRQGFRRQDDVHVEVQRVAAGRRRAARLHARRQGCHDRGAR